MLIPTFNIQLNNPIIKNLVTVGKFDGKHPSLACATSSDNILIHSPHQRNQDNEHEVRQLSVNRTISALTSGNLNASTSADDAKDVKEGDKNRDVLLVGTETNLLAYDVENNSDIFYKDVSDGVNSLVYGVIPSIKSPLAIVGGNCSIQGFDREGNEAFWTVSGDNVTALAFRDCENDGNAELLVGSEDFEIRIFQQEEVVHEATEADVVTGLTHLHKTFFGFSLASGAIGVYNNSNRVWHAKSKHKAVSISSFDLDADGVPELITGWSNGRVEVRKIDDGKLIYKDRFSNPIAHITVADYRMDKRDEIIACAVDGEIRGYLPAEEEKTEMEAAADLMDNNELEMQLKEVYEKKQALLKELKYYENNANKLKSGDMAAGVIPPDTKIELSIRPNKRTKSLTLSLNTNNNTVIKLIIAESDILFENATWVVHPDRPTNALSFPVQMEKYVTTEIKIKAVVGYTSSTQDHVFELTHTLPRFAPFILTRPRTMNVSLPTSSVVFNTSERVGRVKLWINESFNVDETTSKETLSITNDTLQATFLNIKSDLPLLIKVTPDNGGQVHVRCDDMELAGEIVQDMCRYLKIEHLESVADFPTEMKAFGDVLQKVEDHNTTRLRLSAEISHRANIIKNLVIRAEDARILNAARLMKDKYSELFDLNQELIGEYTKRANNHAELLKSLKEVNHMIQKAANLRMGQHKKKVVGSCRKAIKLNNIHALLKIIKVGHPGPGNM